MPMLWGTAWPSNPVPPTKTLVEDPASAQDLYIVCTQNILDVVCSDEHSDLERAVGCVGSVWSSLHRQ